jgi:DNA topoisomerase-1
MNTSIAEYFILKQFKYLDHNSDINQSGGSKNNKIKWTTLKHNGVLFPPPYTPHNIPVKYLNTDVKLTPEQEEAATMYAKYLKTDYVKNSTFNKNFWKDWKKILGPEHIIQNLSDVDFTPIYNYIQNQQKKKNTDTTTNLDKYKTLYIDGVEQPVGNYRIEPPGIFIGRGNHPKTGRIKKRIQPSDITINIGKEEEIPKTPNGDTNWKEIIHDRRSVWIASWKENITNHTKYVWLGSKSNIKAQSDQEKFDTAKKLKKIIKKIRDINYKNMSSDDIKTKQIATALYFIDKLALRVGNEKTSDEADTVGVTSIRVEHIKLHDNNSLTLDFLGKDSIRYVNTITVDPLVHNNINSFIISKNHTDQLFDKINPMMLNKYLSHFMKNLTSKVFRTYNASYLFQKELKKIDAHVSLIEESTSKTNMIIDMFNKANLKVAKLCNHQKKISNSHAEQMKKIKNKIKILKKKKSETNSREKKSKIEDKIKLLKAKKKIKSEMKNLSLGTSKTNYIDPRITVAFIKRHNLPVDRILSKTLKEKFWWAFEVDSNYKF